MKHAIALSALLLISPPVHAQDQDGKSLMEQGMQLFFEGLREEVSPTLRDLRGLSEQYGPALRGFLSEMGPAFAEMLDEVKDWTRYHPPEILSNGDILIRRKTAPDTAPNVPGPETPAPSGPTDI
ncbi:MAG: hypothetical protein AB8B51_10320 [Sedimentitalea sp.]